MSLPKFPRYGEPWFECSTCGLDFPLSQGTKHYKTKMLVDIACQDDRTHADALENLIFDNSEENRTISPQRVKDQGEV